MPRFPRMRSGADGRLAIRPGLLLAGLALLVGLVGCTGTQGLDSGRTTMNRNDLQDPPHVFTLQLRTRGGMLLGEGLNTIHSDLLLDSRVGAAFLGQHRSEADTEGEPIGRFRMDLPPSRLQHFEQLVKDVRLEELGPPVRGGLGTSLLELEVRSGDKTFIRQVNSFDISLLQQVDPLLFELNRLAFELMQHPVAALRVSVSHEASPAGDRFVLTFDNLGRQRILLNDPRLLKAPPDRWAGVRVALHPESKPGFTAPPLQWRLVPLAKPAEEEDVPAELLLEPGASASFRTEPWVPQQRGSRHLMQGVWSDYEGSAERDGILRIRGPLSPWA